MTQTELELVSFFEFAIVQARKAESRSVEDLVDDWRKEKETAEILADIEAAFEDQAAGRCVPMEVVFDEIRQRLGLGIAK